MKKYLLMFALIFTVMLSYSWKKKEIDVYLIRRLSNAPGQGNMVNLPVDF